MLILICLLMLVTWILILRWQRRRKIWCCAQFKNSWASLPLLGHGAYLFGNGEKMAKIFQTLGREALKQGGMTSLHAWIADKFYTVIADPVIADLVLKNFLEKDDSMKSFSKLFPEGLPVVSVPKWRSRRKTLNHAFSMKHLNQYTDHIFRKNSQILVENFKNFGGEPFSIYEYIAENNFRSICETTYGIDFDNQVESKKTMLVAMKQCLCLMAEKMRQPLYAIDFIYEMTPQYQTLKDITRIFDIFVKQNVKVKYEEFKRHAMDLSNEPYQNENKAKSLQQILIENSNGEVTEEYLERDSLIVLFAGTDTSAVSFSFTCLLLAKYPDVQEKIYQEHFKTSLYITIIFDRLEDIFGDSTKPIVVEDLPKLKYIEAVIKESLRLYPPGLVVLRKVEKDLVLPSGQVLVKGTGAMINVWAIHRNPRYWGADAEMFRPERFLDSSLAHPAAYIPFSYGPRNCIGYQYAIMSMKTTLAMLLRHYRFQPARESDNKHQDIRTTFDIVIRDVDNFPIKLVDRKA